MTDSRIVAQLPLWPAGHLPPEKSVKSCLLHTGWLHPEQLPPCVTQSPTVLRCLDLLGPLPWHAFPERDLQQHWTHPTIPYATFAAAMLIKLNEGLPSMGRLYTFLSEHPGFIPLLGFPLVPAPNDPLGFNVLASLPTPQHLTALLHDIPNAAGQFLLDHSVQLIRAELGRRHVPPIDCVSLDTKHIIAWVKENNRKTYVAERYNKDRQPKGDPDCRLGCKRRHNQGAPKTPTRDPVPAQSLKVGEYYWGYGSGVVVAKIPDLGEFVLAEMTQPFDHGDLTYFYPLLFTTEQRLGYRPRVGTFDAAFDAWYVYAYFHRANDPSAFAAVPFSQKGGLLYRAFSPEGLPICHAGLPMPLKFTFTDHTRCLFEHERGHYVCPLRFPERSAARCPVRHKRWTHGGCIAVMPTSIGARLRYSLNRDSDPYKDAYRQRTAVERINSQAVALGIERPHLRNGAAIANQNTLIYTLINLRFLQRLRQDDQDDHDEA